MTIDQLFYSKTEIAENFRRFCHKQMARTTYDEASRPSMREFIRDHREYLELIFKSVRKQTFELLPASKRIAILDKPRTIYRFTWPERFLAMHFARTIDAVTKKFLPPQLYSFQKGRSHTEAVSEAARWIHQNKTSTIFCLRRDIKSYGETLAHSWLLEDFLAYCKPSSSLIYLFKKFCEFPYVDEERLVKTNTIGLPTGSHLQIVFENLYLIGLDKKLSSYPDSWYGRFGDDILFLSTKPVIKDRSLRFRYKNNGYRFPLFRNGHRYRFRVNLDVRCKFDWPPVKTHQITSKAQERNDFTRQDLT